MKKTLLAVLIFLLLITATFVNILKVGVGAATTEDLWTTPALPEGISREPMPENYTTEDYLNTTNPYADYASTQRALDEVDDQEGNKPLYVLVFGDEEERAIIRGDEYVSLSWDEWAKWQIERGDESLVANFGIDIRILGFEVWDSDDSLDTMDGLWYELESDTKQYLRTWYDGEWWSNYVDAVIGITAQETTDNAAGKSPPDDYLDAGRIFILLKWQAYWTDDNLVQHEVSHLYYAPDHPEPQPPAPCCAMAYHTHYQYWIWEDGLWWVFANIPCAYTTYSWCTNCNQTIQQNCGIYPLDVRTLAISASSGGTTDPPPGNHTYRYGKVVTVAAIPDPLYLFYSWNLDGATVFSNPINVTMDSNHTLKAYFGTPAMKTRTDGYFYVPNVATDLLKIEMLFNNLDIVGDQTGGTSPYSTITAYPDRIVDIEDVYQVALNFGKSGTYINSTNPQWLSGVTITFSTSEEKSPDSYGFVTIPQGATNFTVKRNGNPIGAMIIFW